MPTDITQVLDNIDRLSRGAQLEFEDVADYIWKSVRLLKHETELELTKIATYFPNRPDLQKFRWMHESRKLKSTFPFLIFQGNLLTVTALFEIYLLLLVTTVEEVTEKRITEVKGQGAGRSLAFLNAIGIATNGLPNWEQVSIALRIRNCIVHASGSLKYSREQSQLRNIVSSGRFYPQDIRDRHRERELNLDDVTIIEHPTLGERLVITNDYSHFLAALLRDYFIQVCASVRAHLSGPAAQPQKPTT